MAIESTPIFLQGGSHTAEQTRRALHAIIGRRGGVLTPTDLLVTQRAAGVNMSVDVATGQVAVPGSEATYQGAYFVENRGAVNVTIATADATNPRRDLIIVRVRDAQYSGSDGVTIEAVQGTPAGSPADPSLPTGNCFVLARVAVAAGATSITNANVTDLRGSYDSSQYGLLTAAGGTTVCTSTTRPASPFEGMCIFETDTDQKLTYNGSAWITTDQLGTWTTWTPTVTQSATVSKTMNYGRYIKLGRLVIASFDFTPTSGGTAGQPIILTYPGSFTPANTGNQPMGTAQHYNGTSSTPLLVLKANSSIVFQTTTAAAGFYSPSPGLTTTHNMGGTFTYESAS